MAFYDIFESLCSEKDVSPAQVRADLGISQSTMASWKSRELTPKAATIKKLADYFGVSIAYLLGAEEGSVKMPALDVGDTYFNGAMRVTRTEVDANHVNIVFQIDEDKMSAGEMVALMRALEEISNQSGVSIEGLALLAEAAAKALNSAQERPQRPAPAPDGTDTTPPQEGSEGPQEG